MRIDSSNIGMESARTYQSSSTRKLSVSATTVQFSLKQGALSNYDLIGNGNTNQNQEETVDTKSKQEGSDSTATDSQNEDALSKLKSAQTSNASRIKSISDNSSIKSIEQIRQRCILYLWSMFFGQDKASDMADEFGFENPWNSDASASTGTESETSFMAMTLNTTEEYSFQETEETSFSATGTVKTSDGREIQFGVEATMSRSFSQYYKQEGLSVAAMCDPLVINLDNSIAGLSDQKFFFDLDADGEKDEISTLESGNGFLALDKNEDGVINDGSELFGTKSGDGFRDLMAYDEDGNGWIDENDSVYNKLKIWVKDENGNDSLYSLKDKNVGAIYLGNRDTDYTLRSGEDGQIKGAIRKTGVFLYEDGVAGTISHLDIAN